MAKNNNLTFVVFTYNEQHRLERVIKNFINHGHILIADGGSTDRTLEVARKYNCAIYEREEFGFGYVENQPLLERLYQIVETEWIYWAFADEMLDIETLDKLNEIITENKYDIINLDRKNYFYGSFCYNMFHSRTNKCFKKYSVDFSENKIHGFGKAVISDDRILILSDKYFVHHFISNNAHSYLNVINRYTDEEEGKVPTSTFTLLCRTISLGFKMFANDFMRQKGYKAGINGLYLYYVTYLYFLLKEIKCYEKEYNISSHTIEDNNNVYRDEILDKMK